MSGKRKHKLFEAIYRGDGRKVRKHLSTASRRTRGTTDGSTALYLAAVQGEVWTVGALLAAGALPNVESGGDAEGTPGGHAALRRGELGASRRRPIAARSRGRSQHARVGRLHAPDLGGAGWLVRVRARSP